MIRKPRKYQLKAYWHKDDVEWPFYCYLSGNKNITEDIGEKMANSSITIETDSTLHFRQNDDIVVLGTTYRIDSINERVDDRDLNVYRGKPKVIKVISAS